MRLCCDKASPRLSTKAVQNGVKGCFQKILSPRTFHYSCNHTMKWGDQYYGDFGPSMGDKRHISIDAQDANRSFKKICSENLWQFNEFETPPAAKDTIPSSRDEHRGTSSGFGNILEQNDLDVYPSDQFQLQESHFASPLLGDTGSGCVGDPTLPGLKQILPFRDDNRLIF